MGMKPALWRTVAVLCILAALAFAIYDALQPLPGDFGMQARSRLQAPYGFVVTAVEPNSPASRAGIRAGDILNFPGRFIDQAAALYARPGSTLTVTRNGSTVLHLTSQPSAPERLLWLNLAARLAFLLVALLLAWRRPDDRAVRALTVFLFCFGLLIGIAETLLPSPLLSFVAAQVLSLALGVCGMAAATVFAAVFPSGTARPLPTLFARASIVLAFAACLLITFGTIYAQTAAALGELSLVAVAMILFNAALFVTTLIVSYFQGAPEERQRRRWIFMLLGLGLGAVTVDVIVQETAGFVSAVDFTTFAAISVIPFGLAYVILRHRVIDVGFVINRAVVYTLVSIIVVGIFVVVETLLAKYVENTSHVTSVAVQLAVALALGFSIRYVHARVDRIVDTALFRDRHLAEQAIHDFAHDASYITDASVLLTRCITTVEKNAHARGVGIWVAEGTSYRAVASTFSTAPVADENDAAIVAMRARRVNVHVRDCDSLLPGALAFPMIVRGELVGILICGPKTDDETYAPDEQAALASLATSVGHALDAIEIRELRRRLEALSATGGGQPAF